MSSIREATSALISSLGFVCLPCTSGLEVLGWVGPSAARGVSRASTLPCFSSFFFPSRTALKRLSPSALVSPPGSERRVCSRLASSFERDDTSPVCSLEKTTMFSRSATDMWLRACRRAIFCDFAMLGMRLRPPRGVMIPRGVIPRGVASPDGNTAIRRGIGTSGDLGGRESTSKVTPTAPHVQRFPADGLAAPGVRTPAARDRRSSWSTTPSLSFLALSKMASAAAPPAMRARRMSASVRAAVSTIACLIAAVWRASAARCCAAAALFCSSTC
mmetsp:Transcript_23743/g.74270  ORF Transcript_23743/g.74270 Transcript_23743/m.74270 type:complete len:274 (-) Transcript_23743:422-1243(-)